MAGGTAGNKASEIGSRIKHRREELNLSQLELGIRAETSPMAIYGYEKGEHLPRKDTLQRLADALDTTVAALCGKSVTSDEDLHQLTSKEKDFVLRLRQLEGDTRINAENAIDSILTALLSVQNGRRKK